MNITIKLTYESMLNWHCLYENGICGVHLSPLDWYHIFYHPVDDVCMTFKTKNNRLAYRVIELYTSGIQTVETSFISFDSVIQSILTILRCQQILVWLKMIEHEQMSQKKHTIESSYVSAKTVYCFCYLRLSIGRGESTSSVRFTIFSTHTQNRTIRVFLELIQIVILPLLLWQNCTHACTVEHHKLWIEQKQQSFVHTRTANSKRNQMLEWQIAAKQKKNKSQCVVVHISQPITRTFRFRTHTLSN